jgi:hypothetical protein
LEAQFQGKNQDPLSFWFYRLCVSRKILFTFLAESELVDIIDLSKADLDGTNLRRVDLRGANLQNADLRGAKQGFLVDVPAVIGRRNPYPYEVVSFPEIPTHERSLDLTPRVNTAE